MARAVEPVQKVLQIQRLLVSSHRLPVLVAVLTLLVLALTIGVTTRQVRFRIREQIVGRDGAVLHAVAQMQLDEPGLALNLGGAGVDPGDQLTVVLVTSRLKGVIGTRLLDADGRFVEAFPLTVREADLDRGDLPLLRAFKPISRFHPAARPQSIFYPEPGGSPAEAPIPLLEVIVPLHRSSEPRLLGVAQFLIEGYSIRAEFDRLDRHLTFQAVAAFLAAGGILLTVMAWAFHRVRQTHRLLTQRTAHLLQANQELALAAKTTALGALTSHLIHGLKSPLAGLQQFVAGAGRSEAGPETSDWQQAALSTQRMQALINEVVNVLREEEAGSQYELTLAELAGLIDSRVQSLTRERSVAFVSRVEGEGMLNNRAANLVTFILVNLVDNALQATPAGKSVTLRIAIAGGNVVCEVRDQGAGVSDALRSDPFAPRRSVKEGGTGIGLAISKQLANHLGARLELKESSATGSVFALTFPVGQNPDVQPSR